MDKNESIKSTNHPLTVYPAVCSAFIVLLLFFYIEPLLELVNLIIYYPWTSLVNLLKILEPQTV